MISATKFPDSATLHPGYLLLASLIRSAFKVRVAYLHGLQCFFKTVIYDSILPD
jgi:hypothetical protein